MNEVAGDTPRVGVDQSKFLLEESSSQTYKSMIKSVRTVLMVVQSFLFIINIGKHFNNQRRYLCYFSFVIWVKC